jgi:hypothetical protein
MISRKYWVIGGVVVTLLLISAFLLWAFAPTDSVIITDVKKQRQTSGVTLTDTAQISSDRLDLIEERLLIYLKLSGAKATSATKGIVRKDSFNQSTNQYGTETVFMVDFPDLKRSFKVSYSSDPSGYHATNILCPNDTERIYEAARCIDSVSS